MYRILYVDDEPALLDIGKLYLEESGDFIVSTALSAPDGIRLLGEDSFDAVVSDYQMPGMNGITFLKEVRSRFSTLPFILFTGRGREQVVIEAINNGADFYLQKGGDPGAQFAELSHKIRIAVEHRTTDAALKKSQENYRRIVETSLEGIWAMDEHFVTTYVNEQMAEMLGIAADECIGRSIQSFFTDEERSDQQIRLEERTKGLPGRYDRRFVRADGSIRTMSVSATPILGPDGSFKGSFAMLTDITDRKRAEEELAKKNEELFASYEQLSAAEEELRANLDVLTEQDLALRDSMRELEDIIEFLPDATFAINKNGVVIAWNHAMEVLTGVLQADMLDKGNYEYSLPLYRERRPILIDLVLRYDETAAEQYPGIRKDGNRLTAERFIPHLHDGRGGYLWFTSSPLYDAQGTITGAIESIREITEHKERECALNQRNEELSAAFEEITSTEEELRGQVEEIAAAHQDLIQSEEKYRTLAEQVNDGIYIYQGDHFVFSNSKVSEITGYSKEELQTMKFMDLVHPEDRQRVEDIAVQRRRGENAPDQYECRIIRKNGMIRHVELTVSTIQYKGGVAALGSARDITERKLAEEAFLESERRMSAIIDFLPDPTFAIDTEGKVIAWNKAIASLLQVEAPEILGKGNFEHAFRMFGRRRPILIDLIIQGDDAIMKKHYPDLHKERDMFAAELDISRLRGRRTVLWIIATPLYNTKGEITGAIESMRDITERKQAEDALRQSNRKLSILSGITRHDLKNQIHALTAYLGFSKKYFSDPAKMAEFVEKEEQVAKTMERQIAFGREYESIGVNSPAWYDCRTLIDSAIHQVLPGQILVKNEIPKGAKVFADPLIARVFFNLIDNAIRHGGKITTLCFSVEEHAGKSVVVCEDDGDGIYADEKEKIFDQGYGRNTGLGLFLAREILEITEITIAETGEPGKGARFEIAVPKGGYRFADVE
ncbi:PAS domain S-box protein [Methanoregula sp.]|uniref:PAS domain S-box protein n=1 Tax=Methanoregula sp. TaxID=2052170 RepID=UPI0035649706